MPSIVADPQADLESYIGSLVAEQTRARYIGPAEVRALAQKYGQQHGVDPKVLYAMARTETGRDGKQFDTQATSHKGAKGLMQFTDGTAAMYEIDPLDPEQAMDGAARYMKDALKMFGGDYRKAVASYNAGPPAVRSYGGVPPFKETQDYVRLVDQFSKEPDQSSVTGGPVSQNVSNEAPNPRTQMKSRADSWLGTPYKWGGMTKQGVDCSAFISQVWGVSRQTTDSLKNVAAPVARDQMLPGDVLNLPTYSDPQGYGHVRMFDGWANPEKTKMYVYESTDPQGVIRRVVDVDDKYTPMRLNALAAEQATPAAPAIPGVNDRTAPDPTGSSVRDPSDTSATVLASTGFTAPTARSGNGATGPSVNDAGSRDDWRLAPHPHPDTDLLGPDPMNDVEPLGAMDLEKALGSYAPGSTPKLQSWQDQPGYFKNLLDPMSAPLTQSRASARRSSYPFTLGDF